MIQLNTSGNIMSVHISIACLLMFGVFSLCQPIQQFLFMVQQNLMYL